MEKGLSINLGSVEDIPIGQGRCFIVKGEEVAVIRSRDGHLSAIENKCPHLKGPLSDGIVGGGKVICPLHGHKFDLKTGKGSEGHECVNVFYVWEEHGNVMLLYPASITVNGKIEEESLV